MSAILFFLLSFACGWQLGNTIIRLHNGTPLRWIDYAAAGVFVAVTALRVVLL